ncbi:murein transglycosylase A [Azospirillum sp. ST 5-10]|uniref:murein transglycosylase A n=1 Tax=unclassified Azospirillum TaxID=2630922 RepID=UPI003F49BE64
MIRLRPPFPGVRQPRAFGIAAVLAALALGACERASEPEPTPDRLTLTRVAYEALPGWSADRVAEAVPALARSCATLKGKPDDRPVGPDGVAGTVADWRPPCERLAALPPGDDATARAFFEEWFTPYAAANGEERAGLFTGYYEVELRGSRTPNLDFPAALYRRPPDLVTVDLAAFSDRWKGERIAGRVVDGALKPYEDRAAIEAGALKGKGLELLWVDDPIGAFFLQIQGSGRITLRDGSQVRVGYDGQNGHRYFAIGKALIDRGALTREEVSLQSIRDWLRAHPAEADGVMNLNPSYVFFRELGGEGPTGAQGVTLTAGRSLAVDRRFVPYGVPVWLDAEDPLDGGARLQRLLIAQDTGGAIRGPVRGDVFWGYGDEAERRAGAMKSRGGYFLLLPRGVEPRA